MFLDDSFSDKRVRRPEVLLESQLEWGLNDTYRYEWRRKARSRKEKVSSKETEQIDT